MSFDNIKEQRQDEQLETEEVFIKKSSPNFKRQLSGNLRSETSDDNSEEIESQLNDTENQTTQQQSQSQGDGFQADKVVVMYNQFEEDQLHPMLEDVFSEDEEQLQKDYYKKDDENDEENQSEIKSFSSINNIEKLMTEEEKIKHNHQLLQKMVAKVLKDKQQIEKRLQNTKDSNYSYAIQWNEEVKLHKEANLAIEEGKRDIILLKKKQLERIRRDILNIRNLQNEVDPEMYLQIKGINFKKSMYKSIKDFFASIDMIVNKNSLIGFSWEKFSERVFKNKDTVDAFIYKLKYYPFNEMTDYYYSLCKKYTMEEKSFLVLFEQKENKKVQLELIVVKTFIEWMNIMKYGYELNLELIESIKKANLEKTEVEKISIATDILQERMKNQNTSKEILEAQVSQMQKLYDKLLALSNNYSKTYKL